MNQSPAAAKMHFPCAFICTMLSVLIFAASTLLGVWAASLLCAHMDGILHIQRISPYAGCDLAVEYAVRAARLCLPVLTQLFICWLAAYVRFDKILLASVFALRGCSFGMALHLCLLLGAEIPLIICTAVHAGITVIFLMTVFHIRTEEGIRPLLDSITALLIAGGACCAAVIPATLFL